MSSLWANVSVLASAHETLRLCTRLGLVSALRLHTHYDLENAMFTKADLLQSLRQQVTHWRIKVDMQFVTSLPSVFSKGIAHSSVERDAVRSNILFLHTNCLA